MSAAPAEAGWIAAIHTSGTDLRPICTGFLIDGSTVLTAAHGVCDGELPKRGLWVAFPKSAALMGRRIEVEQVVLPSGQNPVAHDVAMLKLAEDVGARHAARLRCPEPRHLVEREWWSYGFSNQDVFGNEAGGRVNSALAYGWVRLGLQTRQGESVKEGFSGAPLWSETYDAVVGVIGRADHGESALALTLWHADQVLPEAKLARLSDWAVEAAGESALAAWGWQLVEDREAGRHWKPRARGVARDSERGFRFRGRRKALTRVADWIVDEQPQHTALVLTGSPGVGKSAVLGRIVTSADPAIAEKLPRADTAVRARPHSVACAVHAKSKSAIDVAQEIAVAASALVPQQLADFAPALGAALAAVPGRLFAVVIDALDEAVNAKEARDMIRWIVRPLVEDLAEVGARVVVGCRRRDGYGDLTGSFGEAKTVIDLDAPGYFELEDLEAYALASLQLLGAERHGNPYEQTEVADPIAKRIAALAKGNFLVAGLIARAHGLHDRVPVRPEELAFSPKVDAALTEFLERIPPVGNRTAAEILTVLAYAEAPGFTAALWSAGVQAIYGSTPGEVGIRNFARASAANFLIEDTAGEGEDECAYRLFHQALNDVLLVTRDQVVADERALTRAFIAQGAEHGWTLGGGYLTRSLPGHAERGKSMDLLLAQDQFPLYCDLRRLLRSALRSYAGRETVPQRMLLLRKSLQAIDSPPAIRAAHFSLMEAQEQLGSTYASSNFRAPYQALWARVAPQQEQMVLTGHQGPVLGVTAFPTSQEDRSLLASCGADGTIRVWDPDFGENLRVIQPGDGPIVALCAVYWPGGQSWLISGSSTGVVWFWEPETGECLGGLAPRAAAVGSLLAARIGDGRSVLFAGYEDGRAIVWDLAAGSAVLDSAGPMGSRWTNTATVVSHDGADDHVVYPHSNQRLDTFDLSTGEHRLGATQVDPGALLCAATLAPEQTLRPGRRRVLARLSLGRPSVTILDEAYARIGSLDFVEEVTAMCQLPLLNQRTQFAVAAGDRTVFTMDAETGQLRQTLTAHTRKVNAMAPMPMLDGGTLIATASDDGTVRLWDPSGSDGVRATVRASEGVGGHLTLTAVGEGSKAALCSILRDDALHVWHRDSGQTLRSDRLAKGQSANSCLIPGAAGEPVLVRPDIIGSLSGLDVFRGQIDWIQSQADRGYLNDEPVSAVYPVVLDGQTLAIAALVQHGRLIRFWSPTGRPSPYPAKPVPSSVSQCCVLPGPRPGSVRLAALCGDGLIRIWGLDQREPELTVQGPQSVERIVSLSRSGTAPMLGMLSRDFLVVWDVEAERRKCILDHRGTTGDWLLAACGIKGRSGRTLVATGGRDRMLRIWDLEGTQIMQVPVRHQIEALVAFETTLYLGFADGVMALGLDDTVE